MTSERQRRFAVLVYPGLTTPDPLLTPNASRSGSGRELRTPLS